MKILHKWLLPICGTLMCNSVFAQSNDTTVNVKYSTAISNFNTAIGPQSRLYIGSRFEPYLGITKGNANFLDATEFNPGNIVYDGISYKNVPIIYDIDKDIVVSLLYNKFTKYTLRSERLTEFNLLDHHFIEVQQDSLNTQITTGFYDELYNNNKLQLIAKRSKSIISYTGTSVLQKEFNYREDFYLKKENIYYKVNSEGSFMSVLKDQKKEMKRVLKDQKIKFKKDPEGAMIKLLDHYNTLSN